MVESGLITTVSLKCWLIPTTQEIISDLLTKARLPRRINQSNNHGGVSMNKRGLLVLSMVALLGMAAMVAISGAQSGPGMSSTSPVMQGAGSQPTDPPKESAGPCHHRHSLEAIYKKLGITDEQKTKIRALRVGFQDRTRKTRMDLRSLKDEKKTMLLSGKIDRHKLSQMDDQVVKLVIDVLRERLKLRRDRLALMTPEQIGRIADLQAEKAFRSKWRRMHRWSMHRPGEFAGQWHHRPSLKAIMEKLGITDQQKAKIRALYVGFQDRTRETRTGLRSLRDEKKTMVLSGKIDEQKLAQMDDQVVKLVSDVLREKLKLRRDRLALMTPKQIGRIADFQAEKAFRTKWKRMH